MDNDISPLFRWNPTDAMIGGKIAACGEDTRAAVACFCENCDRLTNYAYWFFLSTLWVKDADAADLQTWKRFFSSERKQRKRSIMKPSEVTALEGLPYFITAYRAHRTGETDWIAYTTDRTIVKRFAVQRGAEVVNEYRIKKRDVLAYFTRRGESEILDLDKSRAQFVQTIALEDLQ